MKTTSAATLALVLAAGLALGTALCAGAAEGDPEPKAAVLRAENRPQNPWWNEVGAERAQNALIARLEASEPGSVMASREVAETLAAERLWLTGEITPAGAIRVGRELGVRHLVVITLVDYGTSARGLGKKRGRKLLGLGGPKYFWTEIVLRLIDTEAGRTVWSDSRRGQTLLSEVMVPPADIRQSVGTETRLVEATVFEGAVLPFLDEMAAPLSATLSRLRQGDGAVEEVGTERADVERDR